MKVKVIKLDERYLDYATDEEKGRVGKIFEALKFHDNHNPDERYYNMYALGLEDGVWFLPASWCEVVEEGTINPDTQETQHSNITKDILLVEDGSVDIDKLEEEGFYVIVYRQGAKPPMLLTSQREDKGEK